MEMSKVIRLMSKTDLVKNCLNYFKEMGVPAPDRSTIFHYLAKCFPGMYFKTILHQNSKTSLSFFCPRILLRSIDTI